MFFFLLVLRTTSSPHIQFPDKKYSSIASENKKGVMTPFPLKIAPSIVLFFTNYFTDSKDSNTYNHWHDALNHGFEEKNKENRKP